MAPPSRRSVAWAALGAVVAVTMVATALAACAASSPTSMPRLPVLGTPRDVYDGDFGDPFILTAAPGSAPRFVLFGTDDPPDHVPTATSDDGTQWEHGPDALPTLPAWASPDPQDSLTWAPTALHLGDAYLLYVSVQEAASHRQCIAVTRARAAEGPYRDALGTPLVCQRRLGGSIDPSVLVDGHGVHLVWKSDGNCCGLATALYEQDLGADGTTLLGTAHRLLTADEPWQGGIVENPALLPATGGGWWLFYSANRFDDAAYATGLAWCPTLRLPCEETGAGPFLHGTSDQFSPGGLDFFRNADGTRWAAFATWNRPARNGRFFCCRSLETAAVVSS